MTDSFLRACSHHHCIRALIQLVSVISNREINTIDRNTSFSLLYVKSSYIAYHMSIPVPIVRFNTGFKVFAELLSFENVTV